MAIAYKHIIVLILQFAAVRPDTCWESISTLSYVPSCPENESELKQAIQKKQCDELAKVQSCTEAKNFRYHCIPNSWKNATVEVCAPVIYSQGYCIEFDEGGSQLQELYEEDCTNFTINKCSTRFLSSDLLHYKQCNSIIKRRTLERPEVQRENKHYMILLISAITFGTLFLISLVIGAACIWRLCVKIRVKDRPPVQDQPSVELPLVPAHEQPNVELPLVPALEQPELGNSSSHDHESSSDEEQTLFRAHDRDIKPSYRSDTEAQYASADYSQIQNPDKLIIADTVYDNDGSR